MILNPSYLKVISFSVLSLLIYFIIPLCLPRFLSINPLGPLLFFYTCNSLIIIFFFRKGHLKANRIALRIEEFSEKINLLNVELSRAKDNSLALKEKNFRYNSLARILEKINSTLDLDAVTEALTNESFSLINQESGVCILYLINHQNQRLMIFKSKTGRSGMVIKAKEGDILDLWVLRHGNPLLVEDIRNDFRFDPEKLNSLYSRPVSSLVSAPFLIENKQLGILRLDNEKVYFYTQDDLRFLAAISDLGAIAIENSELFKRAQDLAIHDSLTGLYTKSYFLERFKEECKRSSRQGGYLSLLMLDIDFFKKYNDQFGHAAGDIVLMKLSKLITNSLHKFNPVISRFGGEEFCVAMLALNKKEAFKAADSLRIIIESEKIILRRTETSITVSIGLANLPEDTPDDEELIRKADKAMYTAKQSGRNRVCCI